MKTKLIRVLLGAIGSMITIVISHYANGSVDPATAALALSAGSAAAGIS